MAALFLLVAGCATRPSHIAEQSPVIMLKSVRLPALEWVPWFSRFAEHSWIDFRFNGIWRRMEWDNIDHIILSEMDEEEAFENVRWDRSVAVHQHWSGLWADETAAKILEIGEHYPNAKHYTPWPGPNSNTFIEWLAQKVDLPIVMPPAALGKDYTPWLRAGVSSSNTGIEVETMILGVQIGLREGVEMHLLGLTLGVGIWPPAIKLPFLPAIPGGWFAP